MLARPSEPGRHPRLRLQQHWKEGTEASIAAAFSQWRFTSLRRHGRQRSSSWGSPNLAVSDGHPKLWWRCRNAVNILQNIIRFSKDERKILFHRPVLRQQAQHSSFLLYFFRLRAQTSNRKTCGKEQLSSEISFYVTIALKKIQLTWRFEDPEDAIRRAATTSYIGSH